MSIRHHHTEGTDDTACGIEAKRLVPVQMTPEVEDVNCHRCLAELEFLEMVRVDQALGAVELRLGSRA